MFAARAGAKKVIGVDMSDVIYQAMDIIRQVILSLCSLCLYIYNFLSSWCCYDLIFVFVFAGVYFILIVSGDLANIVESNPLQKIDFFAQIANGFLFTHIPLETGDFVRY